MKKDSRIFLITADLGYGVLDRILADFPERALNVGSCEMLMIGMAVGLSYSGYIPVCYSITPFVLYRPFEMIRNYAEHEKVPIKLIGTGRNKDYGSNGFTHWAEDDESIVKAAFPSMKFFKPEVLDDSIVNEFLYSDAPAYINLKR
jgi:transketolase